MVRRLGRQRQYGQSAWPEIGPCMMLLLILLGVGLAALPRGAVAQTYLNGMDSPALEQAVQDWLDDDDQRSLPALARLANEGNIAAGMLVARIERTTKHFSPWVHALTRKRRLALFRRPSRHLFSPGWIGWYAYKGVDLAVTLEDAGLSRTSAWLVHELVDAGEVQASDTLIRRIMFYGNSAQRAQVAGANLPLPELAPYVTAMDQPGKDSRLGMNALQFLVGEDALKGLKADEVLRAADFVNNGLPFQTLPAGHPLHDALADKIADTKALLPITNQCNQACPNDFAQCAVTMMGLHGGYYESIRIDSPLESVISQERFLDSERASGIALRRAALARDGAATQRASIETIWSFAQCLGVAVRGVREAHVNLFR